MTAAKPSKNYEFYLSTDLSEYAGKWIAIVDGKVVTAGDRADQVGKETEGRYPDQEFALVKVPTGDTLIR